MMNIDFLTYLDETLTRMGYEIAGMAITGESAVENARLLRPDLILMDIVMPGQMDGIDAAKIIRDEMNIPIIFVTSDAEKNFVERAKQVTPRPISSSRFGRMSWRSPSNWRFSTAGQPRP